jgi:hypothetical protein
VKRRTPSKLAKRRTASERTYPTISVRVDRTVYERIEKLVPVLSRDGLEVSFSDVVRVVVAHGLLDLERPPPVRAGERCAFPVADEQNRAKLCAKPATEVRIVEGADLTYCAEHAPEIDKLIAKGVLR